MESKGYTERFLYKNVERGLVLNLLNPTNYIRILSPYFGRSDMAAEYYDRILFDKKTLGDIRSASTPYIAIQATDVQNGLNFTFSPYMFSLICSDFDAFPVSRAVAASAAFPGPFTPIVLKNYAGSCNFSLEEWVHATLNERDTTSRAFGLASKLIRYADSEEMPYIHLLDGGIADNLGLRSGLDIIQSRGPESFADAGMEKAKKIIFIVVNAASKTEYSWSLLGKIPGVGAMLRATSTVMVDTIVHDTLYLFHSRFTEWMRTYAKRFPEKPKPELYVAIIEFEGLKDAARRRHFHGIPTTLTLPEETVDELRMVARELLFDSSEFQRFVNDVGGSIP
jgi:NTE family protein